MVLFAYVTDFGAGHLPFVILGSIGRLKSVRINKSHHFLRIVSHRGIVCKKRT